MALRNSAKEDLGNFPPLILCLVTPYDFPGNSLVLVTTTALNLILMLLSASLDIVSRHYISCHPTKQIESTTWTKICFHLLQPTSMYELCQYECESLILCKRSAIQLTANCTTDVVNSHRISRQSSLIAPSRGSTLLRPRTLPQSVAFAHQNNSEIEQILGPHPKLELSCNLKPLC